MQHGRALIAHPASHALHVVENMNEGATASFAFLETAF
jgi:hypothetical protein